MLDFQKPIERMKPAFEKIASNPYLSAVRDGFIAAMPIILFSSLFLLITYLPNAWGFYWSTPVANTLMIAYNYSMGLLALFVTGTTAKNLTDYKNLSLPKTNAINPISVIISSEITFFILAVHPLKEGVDLTYLGTQGLIAAYFVGLIVPNIYYVCVKNNLTIKLPPQVPQNIAQTFKDVLPLGFSVTIFWGFDVIFKLITKGQNLPTWIISILSPLFSASDSYVGLCIIAGAMAFFWFIGVQGPSIVTPAIAAFAVANTTANLHLVQGGGQATHILALNTQDYVMNLGGTGSTFVLAYLFLIFAKSKQLRTIGKASFIPVTFSVNEPILFGAPIIMNPIFFIPFIFTPMVNVSLFKFFVSTLGMNSMIYNMPWTIPGPIGIILSTGFAPLSFLLVVIILVLDILIWFPFMKAYDRQMLAEESQQLVSNGIDGEVPNAISELGNINTENVVTGNGTTSEQNSTLNKETNVLVLCAGGGTSGILANALNKIAKGRTLPLSATARAYGQDMDLIQDMDLVILAPQMESMKDNLQKVCDKYDTKLVTTTGRQYIELTQDADKAISFVTENA
ncbi:MAG: system, lactose-specific component / system, lactose-specific component [Sporolactobacillus laevolacticus]|jgi:PTS system lactose-specific IIC component|nr:system, lactose-specific component / system, lactose-specific component [Sporolactobacillus laevolacticus]